MIIDKYSIGLSATHQKTEAMQIEERLRAWTDGGRVREGSASSTEEGKGEKRPSFDFEAELSRISIEAQHEKLVAKSKEKGRKEKDEAEDVINGDTKLKVMKLLVEEFSGEKVSLYNAKDQDEAGALEEEEGEIRAGEGERAGFGVEYDYKEIHIESETTRFEASGNVTTADGRQISFDVNMEMHREQIDVKAFSLRAGDAKLVDPLVVNFGAGPASLSDEKVAFDLDQDGELENISFVKSGSGFLVIDKNGDGKATDGGELFGPSTGDGFKELSQYDDDRNGWIDEQDAVYNDLRIWTRYKEDDALSTLKQSNVGAIYLGNVATPFDIETGDELAGQVQSSGVFLRETGEVGTIQQVDLVT